jgi:hypothetical protein
LTETKPKTGRGGKREGAGLPHGFKYPKTLEREQAKQALDKIVREQIEPLCRALMKKAMGVDHFMLRDPDNGQWKRLEDPVEIAAALNAPGAAEGRTYWIHTKDPDVAAAKDLLDRAIGKAVEEVKVEHTGKLDLVEKLKGARERSRD